MNWQNWIILVLMIMVISLVGLVVFQFYNSQIVPNDPNIPQIEVPDVPITNFSDLIKEIPKEVIINNLTFEKNPTTGPRIVSGTLYNNGTKVIAQYEITIGVYNATGNGVGTITIVGLDVGPGDKEDFKSPVPDIPNADEESVKLLNVYIYDVRPTPI